ncbi:MAG: hypothetical protein IKH69_00195 [Bacteroidaceae bacterium]|nr:hypothetical protein [Bacteroidaceae bacterium]
MKGNRKILSSLPVLLLVQLIGIVLCAWLKLYDITPLSDAMGLSVRWDFTVDFIALLFIVLPAVVTFVQRMPHWRYSIALACLPLLVLFIGMGYFIINYQTSLHQAKLQRMAVYDSAEKIEKVIGIPFPEFEIKNYKENTLEGSWQNRKVCKSEIEFSEQPSERFFQTLDSLCLIDSKWHKSDNVYLFDSIRGRSLRSLVVLSLVLTKNKNITSLEYDVINNNN